MTKKLHIHLGPHKTGSSAIQSQISGDIGRLLSSRGISVVPNNLTRALGKMFSKGQVDSADSEVLAIRDFCLRATGDSLLSCEDFSGDLPGRSRDRRVYPNLVDNMLFLQGILKDIDLRFYFFVRDPSSWARSAYVQIAKHRHRFTSFESYFSFIETSSLWDGVLAKARAVFGDKLVEIEYQENVAFDSLKALLDKFIDLDPQLTKSVVALRSNTSPSEGVVSLLELINSSGASAHAKKSARHKLLADNSGAAANRSKFVPIREETHHNINWPPSGARPPWLADDLDPLWKRVEIRVSKQEQPDLIAAYINNLDKIKFDIVHSPEEFPQNGRDQMEDQLAILRYRFRGYPEVCLAMGLAISYLRRDTPHTAQAQKLFFELWAKEHEVLLGTLPTRWLISSFQTFMEHGANETQRVVGAAFFFFSNTLKAYEAERSLEGLQPDAVYPSAAPTTKNGVSGLDRFKLGGTDLFLNMNALLLDLASRDEIVGRVSQEFMLRIKYGATIFSRMDRSRIAHSITIKQFSNCWSFFERPD